MKRSIAVSIFELILGLLLIVAAILVFVTPAAGLETFVILYGLGAVMAGVAYIVRFIAGVRRGAVPVLTLIGGIASIVLGCMLLFNIAAGALAITLLFPLWIIVYCVIRLVNLGFVWRYNKGYFVFGLIVNLLGIVVAVLLMMNPVVSALTLAYMLAFYLFFTGIDSIIFAIVHMRRGGTLVLDDSLAETLEHNEELLDADGDDPTGTDI